MSDLLLFGVLILVDTCLAASPSVIFMVTWMGSFLLGSSDLLIFLGSSNLLIPSISSNFSVVSAIMVYHGLWWLGVLGHGWFWVLVG